MGINDGAPEGDYKVAIIPKNTKENTSTYNYSIPNTNPAGDVLPRKYYSPETSDVACSILPGGKPLVIDLK